MSSIYSQGDRYRNNDQKTNRVFINIRESMILAKIIKFNIFIINDINYDIVSVYQKKIYN